MGRTERRRYLEACYARPIEHDAWLHGVNAALGRLVSPSGGTFLATRTGMVDVSIAVVSSWGRVRSMIESTWGPDANVSEVPVEVLKSIWRFRSVATYQKQIAHIVDKPHEGFERYWPGYVDVVYMMARTGRVALMAGVPLREGDQTSRVERELRRLRRHFEAGLVGLGTTIVADADTSVLDLTGRVVHAGGAPPSLAAMALLRAVAKAYDRERCGDEPTPEADSLWRELWEGGWIVAETVDSDGKRMLLLKRDRTRRAGASRLSASERRILERIVKGCSAKEIGLDLGLSASTVSEHLSSGVRKLGFLSTMEFMRNVSQ